MTRHRTLAQGRPLLDEEQGLMRFAFSAPPCISGVVLAWKHIPGGEGLFAISVPAKRTRRARRRARGRRILVSRWTPQADWGPQSREAAQTDAGLVRVRW